eukprot:1696228-Pleurochrysis_carterae.AAC.2
MGATIGATGGFFIQELCELEAGHSACQKRCANSQSQEERKSAFAQHWTWDVFLAPSQSDGGRSSHALLWVEQMTAALHACWLACASRRMVLSAAGHSGWPEARLKTEAAQQSCLARVSLLHSLPADAGTQGTERWVVLQTKAALFASCTACAQPSPEREGHHNVARVERPSSPPARSQLRR